MERGEARRGVEPGAGKQSGKQSQPNPRIPAGGALWVATAEQIQRFELQTANNK